MTTSRHRIVLVTLATLLAAGSVCAADSTPPTANAPATPKKHALRGVITGIMADRSALLVKHEAIPGVMRAMTMMFRVDAATLAAAKEGQAITGLMSRQGDAWVLEDVQPAPAKP
jgi:Cu/Ag efflux protein CusF